MDRLKVLTNGDVRRAAAIPGNAQQRIAIGRAICRAAEQKPGQLLDFGIGVLRALPQDNLPEDERETFWPLVGLLEWANTQLPSGEEFNLVWGDLQGLYPRAPAFWRKRVEAVLSRHFPNMPGLELYFSPPYEPFLEARTLFSLEKRGLNEKGLAE
jgi:hypothetical protein